jgi:uncharacterized protein YecE (DUF72 family)
MTDAASATDERLRIGLSGWSYPAWRQDFYAGVPQRRWLAHCASHFNSIEVNATFYRLLKSETYVRWRDETSDGFRFAIKGHRLVTHLHRLAEAGEAIGRQRDRTAGLGNKLAVVLWQLPASLHKDIDRLGAVAKDLGRWPAPRHAVEFRHPSWFDADVAACLTEYGITVCQSDAPKWPLWDAITTDLVYVRLHGHSRIYASSYSHDLLRVWAARAKAWLAEDRRVHIYFDNDAEGAAPKDALRLMQLCGLSRPEIAEATA